MPRDQQTGLCTHNGAFSQKTDRFQPFFSFTSCIPHENGPIVLQQRNKGLLNKPPTEYDIKTDSVAAIQNEQGSLPSECISGQLNPFEPFWEM